MKCKELKEYALLLRDKLRSGSSENLDVVYLRNNRFVQQAISDAIFERISEPRIDQSATRWIMENSKRQDVELLEIFSGFSLLLNGLSLLTEDDLRRIKDEYGD